MDSLWAWRPFDQRVRRCKNKHSVTASSTGNDEQNIHLQWCFRSWNYFGRSIFIPSQSKVFESLRFVARYAVIVNFPLPETVIVNSIKAHRNCAKFAFNLQEVGWNLFNMESASSRDSIRHNIDLGQVDSSFQLWCNILPLGQELQARVTVIPVAI